MSFSCQPRSSHEIELQMNAVRPPRIVPSSNAFLMVPPFRLVRLRVVLAHGKNVSVGIFEPGDFVAAGSCPDAKFLVLNEWVFFEDDAAGGQPADERFDVLRFPTHDG